MMRDRPSAVAITGAGAISALGLGVPALWQAMVAGRTGIARLRHPRRNELRVGVAAQVPDDFDPGTHFDQRQLPLLDRVTQFALIAAREAVEQSGLDLSSGALACRTAVVLGTGAGGENTHDAQTHRLYAEQSTRVHPLTIVRLMASAPASQVSIAHRLRGPAFMVTSACASSNHALAQAMLLIRSGQADVVIAGGTEACLSYSCLRAWEAMRVLAEDTCRPFSADRRGLVLGEGAGVFVLESTDHARARGARPLALLAGAGMTADAVDVVAPDTLGASAAMNLALADAGLAPQQVQYINAHGTGTLANDVAETQALRRSFGTHASRLAVSSTKPIHGHALGASGALELVAVLGALREGVLPPTLNLDVADPACDLDYVANVSRRCDVEAALTNSFAFGGLNAVLAITRA